MSINRMEQFWPEWKVGEMIGEGSFGKVYKAVREEHSLVTSAAIKVISIPQNDAELASLRSEGWDEGATKTYFQGIVDDFVNEIKLMVSMKGTQNIVSVEDYKVVAKEDKVGWDIFIRMELLTSLVEHTSENKLSEEDIIKVGTDILGALELCAQKSIIHRDIKPENIFISSFGYYKLGDFGIARELEKTAGSMSQKGTFNYIAPEVAAGRHYDATVDTYSLGIVLYKLLNNNRLPFLDNTAQVAQYQDRKNALDKRLNGEMLPAPTNASHSLTQVILKACAYNPQDRYSSPEEFRIALEKVKTGEVVPEFSPTITDFDASRTVGVTPVQRTEVPAPVASQPVPVPQFGQTASKPANKKLFACVIAGAAVVIAGIIAIFLWNSIGPGNPINQVVSALENQDFAEAVSVFNEHRHDVDMVAMETALSQRLVDLQSEYLNEEISYNEAHMELNTIRNWQVAGLNQQINEVTSFVNSLNDSRVAFQLAEMQLANGDYINAISNFQLVTMNDPNFNAAREGSARATQGHRDAALAEAAIFADNGNFVQAMLVIDNALIIVGNDATLANQREAYRRQEVETRIGEAQSLSAGNNFTGAMNILRMLEQQTPAMLKLYAQ